MKQIIFVLLSITFSFFSTTFAQQNVSNKFVGDVDSSLTINKIVLLPATDNLNGIYANAVNPALKDQLQNDLKWGLVDFNPDSLAKATWSGGLFDGNPDLVKKVAQAHGVDALITANLSKGPSGVVGQVTLYLAKDGQPFLEESFKDPQTFETAEIKDLFINTFKKLKSRIPYQGLVLSRKGQTVTLNMGIPEGIKVNDEITAIHIIQVNRHPKLRFAVSTEKEILGKIKIFKVDSALSFGNIVLEKEPGVIQVGSKLLGKGFVSYPAPMVDKDGKLVEGLSQRADQDVAFGNNPREWLDTSRPQFGRLGLFIGNSFYNHNTNLNTIGGVPASSAFSPNIALKGELWITRDLIVDYKLRQSVFSITNNLGGSSPRNVNMSLSQYGLAVKTSLLMTDDFFGPKWNLGAGFTQTKFDVDDTTPEAYTSNNFGGLHLNLGGQFPLSNELPMIFGADFEYYLTKSLSEGKTSGSPKADIINFQVYVDYLMSIKSTLRAEILFESYSGKMSGTGSRTYPATSTSHRLTTFNLGYNWLF